MVTIKAQLELIRQYIRDQISGTIAVYLFGSWGTEQQRQDSDLDLAFLQAYGSKFYVTE